MEDIIKTLINIVMVAKFLLISCVSEQDSDGQVKGESEVILDQLKESGTYIRELLDESSCSDSEECTAAPMGVKACGGPTSYVYFSTKMEKLEELQDELSRYNSLSDSYNTSSGTASDCSLLSPPEQLICDEEMKCVEG